jgi:ribosomal protein L19
MSTIIQDIERRQLREVPRFKAGDTVRPRDVHRP